VSHDLPTHSDVRDAARLLAAVFAPTPLQHAPRLSELTGREVFLKREDLNPVRSYKGRGAFVAVSKAVTTGVSSVVCASAGNHAQGLAAACRALQVSGTVVVPSSTPRQKRDRIQHFGGDLVELIVEGRTYDDAAAHAASLAREHAAELIPAFDHQHVIAGQGTVALEIDQQLSDAGIAAATVVVPVGGGGLLAGSALALAGSGHSLFGVESNGAASWHAALAAGRPVRLDRIDSFVDGAAVARVGALTFGIVQPLGVEVLTVPEGAVATTMLELYQNEGIITEPAGALALAALGQVAELAPAGPLVFVVSGGNNDVSRYAEVLERSLVHRGIKQYFLLEFDQVPGALRRFLDSALSDGDDIVLFEYVKKSNRESGPALVGIELQSPDGLEPLQQRMTQTGIRWERVEPGSALQRFLV
jgi:threonine dehydratase